MNRFIEGEFKPEGLPSTTYLLSREQVWRIIEIGIGEGIYERKCFDGLSVYPVESIDDQITNLYGRVLTEVIQDANTINFIDKEL